MKLDRSRPYAETIGPSVARYHQDGRDFDSAGNELAPDTNTPPPASETGVTGGEPAAPTLTEPARRKPGRPPKVVE